LGRNGHNLRLGGLGVGPSYVWGLGFGARGLGSKFRSVRGVWDLRSGGSDSRIWVSESGSRLWGSRFGVWGLGFGVWGLVSS
jgi:hypothetical protein